MHVILSGKGPGKRRPQGIHVNLRALGVSMGAEGRLYHDLQWGTNTSNGGLLRGEQPERVWSLPLGF